MIRQFADQALSRSAGAPLVSGNHIELLYDSKDNFPAWEAALAQAKSFILIEMYIIENDRIGKRILQLLAEQALAGVRVYVLYDWLGSWRAHLAGSFKTLQRHGGQVRAFNPPSLTSGISLFGRNHRKQIIVDGEMTFISGLGISASWEGKPGMRETAWRDTGMKLTGPLVREAILAFADSWACCGAPLEENIFSSSPQIPTGNVAARLIATTPYTASMIRLDLLITSFARKTLWITDAYFVGTSLYLQALKQAAQDGVDVRLLVPRSSDIAWIATISRTLYRPLLEAGVRVFEWNGPMIHAKTAVADGRWARIGSTNLNISSWLANRELDVAIEDDTLAHELANQFLSDLGNATEVVLSGHNNRPVLSHPRHRKPQGFFLPMAKTTAVNSATAAARQAARISDAVGAVVRGTRQVESSEATSFLTIGLFLLGIAVTAIFFPYLIAGPLAVIMMLSGGAIVVKALTMSYKNKKKKQQSTHVNQRSTKNGQDTQ